MLHGRPVLLPADHPMRLKYADYQPPGRVRWWARRPEDRRWSRRSVEVISRVLEESEASSPDRLVVNLGVGSESVFQRAFIGRPAVARIGLPHDGKVDVYGDVTCFPLRDGSVDLFMSSSVLEHVVDPEKGVSEMARVLRPSGLVYAEIPFMRAFHMAPHDYQRYTISGIKELFGRHGFDAIETGVSSGPFTATALFFADMWRGFVSGRRWIARTVPLMYWLTHPLKRLDRLVEGKSAERVNACNFFYVGRRLP
jgi:SAM-dependent methyltransferase